MTRDLTPEFWADMARLLPRSGAVVIDVGAHLLEEAALLLPHLENAAWHAFEPNPECYRTCSDLIVPALIPKSGKTRVNLTCAAVGAACGETTLYLSAQRDGKPWTASSSTRAPKNVLAAYPWLHFPNKITVPVTTLDTYCQSKGIDQNNLAVRVHLVKMDVQGAEADVIRGGRETFSHTKYVVTEVVENEEYEGQLGLQGLVNLLPGHWSLAERTSCDALLRNNDL